MALYNTSNITDARNFFEITYAINQLSEGWLFMLFMITLFFVILIVFKNSATIKQLMVADTFICLFITVLLFFNGLTGYITLTIFSIGFFAALMVYMFTE